MTEYGQLPALRISAPDGAQATVTLYGAQLVSWRSADGQERLFVSRRSALDGSAAIRGGVPVIFPQFGLRGSGPRHGYARLCNWRLVDSGIDAVGAFATLELAHGDLPAAMAAQWPQQCTLRLRIALAGAGVEITLDVQNTGASSCSFSGALHSYLRVAQLDAVRVDGLQGVHYTDASTQHTGPLAQSEAQLDFSVKRDRLYVDVPGALTVHTGDTRLRLTQTGFTDAVGWNPGAQDALAMTDLGDDEYTHFVCIEAALIEAIELAAGAHWRGWHRIEAA